MSRIADVTLNHAKIRIVLRQKGVPEEHRIVDRDLVTLIKQLGHQQTSAVTRTTRDENAVEESVHGNARYLGRGLCEIDRKGRRGGVAIEHLDRLP